jgi:hypothetical protein
VKEELNFKIMTYHFRSVQSTPSPGPIVLQFVPLISWKKEAIIAEGSTQSYEES